MTFCAKRSLRFAVMALGLVAATIGQVKAGIVTVDLGTSAPPATLGGYTMTPFAPDGSAIGTVTSSLVTPIGGNLTLSPGIGHRTIGNGWATWSHGYTGDVYTDYSSTSLTLGLPVATGAFYFYAEPDPLRGVLITAESNDGTILSMTVHGNSGANGFGFYVTGSSVLSSITVTSNEAFAVGEFGIARTIVTAVPEPTTLASGILAAFVGLGFARARRNRAKARA